jgi:PAS domain S-box-containing protein
MLLLSLPILPVTWAGIKLGHELPLEYTGLAIGLKLHSASISAAAFVAGLSAASATIIVTTLALANMCLNHLVLPARNLPASREQGTYNHPGWLRGLLIALLILGGYAFYIALSGRETITALALVAFIGTLQFLPAIVATLYWPNTNRKGLLTGLCAGLATWFFTLLLPLISGFEPQFPGFMDPDPGGHSDGIWAAATMASLTLNSAVFIIISVLTRAGAEERGAAEICSMDDLTHPTRQSLSLHEPAQFIDNLPIGVCSIGGDGELLIWNRSMEQTTGIRAEDARGSLLDSLEEPWREVIGDFVLGNATTVLKQEVATSRSSSRWISLHKASTDDSTGTNNDRVILVEDITDYERMEQELLHSERLASIGQLAAGVAHEIGNPVTGIACLAQNLEFETDAAEIRDTAFEILKQTDRVTRIVESLVNFSHVGSRAGDLELTPSNLADCVDEAIHLLQLDHEAKPVYFENHSDRELVVLADSQRLLQVFINLLGNARDACEPGGEVRVLAEMHSDLVTIHIEDNGCGIAAERQVQVFDPFYTTKDPGEGTGLGLALVFTIMEDMNGSVQVESPIGSGSMPGTRVTLELPLGSYGSEFDL